MTDIGVRYGLILLVMLLDIISGIVRSKVDGEKISSSIMYKGLWKKMSVLVTMFLSDIFYVMSEYYLGIHIDIRKAVFLYNFAMETVSIAENSNGGVKELFLSFLEKIGIGGKDGIK